MINIDKKQLMKIGVLVGSNIITLAVVSGVNAFKNKSIKSKVNNLADDNAKLFEETKELNKKVIDLENDYKESLADEKKKYVNNLEQVQAQAVVDKGAVELELEDAKAKISELEKNSSKTTKKEIDNLKDTNKELELKVFNQGEEIESLKDQLAHYASKELIEKTIDTGKTRKTRAKKVKKEVESDEIKE